MSCSQLFIVLVFLVAIYAKTGASQGLTTMRDATRSDAWQVWVVNFTVATGDKDTTTTTTTTTGVLLSKDQ